MRCDLLCYLNRPTVFQVRRDAGGPERMAAGVYVEAGGLGAPVDHSQHVFASHPVARQLAIAAERGEQRAALVITDARRLDVGSR